MASVLKVDRIETPSGTGNISLAQPISGDGSQLTGITAGTPADDSVTGAKIDLSLVAGDIMYASGVDTLERLPKGTDGEVLILASGVPSWVAGSTPADDSITGAKIDLSLVAGDIIYSDATDSIERLAKGTDGEVLTLASGVPSWASAGGGGTWNYISTDEVAHGASTTYVTYQNLTTYRHYVFLMDLLRSSGAGDELEMQLSSDNGTTWNGDGNDRYICAVHAQQKTTEHLSGGENLTAIQLESTATPVGSDPYHTGIHEVWFSPNAFASERYSHVKWAGGTCGSSTDAQMYQGAGFLKATEGRAIGGCDAVRFRRSSGYIGGCRISLYGISHS